MRWLGRAVVAAAFLPTLLLLGTGRVLAADLAFGASSVGSFWTGTSSTPTTVTGASVTVTTDASHAAVSWYGGCIAGYSSSGGFQEIWLYIDGAAVTSGYVLIAAGNQYWNCSFSYITDLLSAATHTFTVRSAANSGGTQAVIQGSRLAVQELPGTSGGSTGSTGGEMTLVGFSEDVAGTVNGFLFVGVVLVALGSASLVVRGLRR